jgi:purine-binding chemotaxis protein CheW
VPRKAKKAEEPAVAAEEIPLPAEVTPPEEETPEPVADSPEWDDDAVEETPGESQAVTFTLGGQLYGLPIEVVQEIQQLVEFTPMPDVAPALVGLVDIRGAVVPAIDLRVLVGMESRPMTLQTPMVFCRVRGHVVCLIVDGVEDVVDLPDGGLQPPSGLYSISDRMLGMCRLPQGLLLMLDIERLVPEVALAVADAQEGEA